MHDEDIYSAFHNLVYTLATLRPPLSTPCIVVPLWACCRSFVEISGVTASSIHGNDTRVELKNQTQEFKRQKSENVDIPAGTDLGRRPAPDEACRVVATE